jgi:hypothetical protein
MISLGNSIAIPNIESNDRSNSNVMIFNKATHYWNEAGKSQSASAKSINRQVSLK